MSEDQAELIASKIQSYTDFVNISAGYGEPFLNPKSPQILSIIKSHGIKTVAYTNASKTAIDNIIKSKIYLLLISIDSHHFTDKESIERIIKINYDKEEFASFIRLNVVLDPHKEEEHIVDYARSLCKQYPSIVAEFHWQMSYEPAYNRTAGQTPLYHSLIRGSKSFILPPFSYSERNKCNDIFNALYFDEGGNLRTCCIYMDSFPQLNIYKDDVPTIFNSSYLEAKRDYFINNNGFPQCANCPIGHGFLW